MSLNGSELRSILDNVTDGFYALDSDWRFTYINRRALEIIGARKEDILGQVIWETYPEAVQTIFYERYHRAVKAKRTEVFEGYYEPLDLWLEVRAYPQPSGLAVYFTDIFERKKIELEKEKFQRLVETSGDFIGFANLNGEFYYLNEGGQKLIGLDSKNAVTNDSIADCMYEDDQRRVREEILPAVRAQGKWIGEARFRNAHSGEGIPTLLNISQMQDPVSGGASGISCVGTDLREYQKKQALIQRQTEIMNQIYDAVIVTDYEGVITGWNKGAVDLFGYVRQEVIGKPVHSIWPSEESHGKLQEVYDEVRRKGKMEREVKRAKKNGETIDVQSRYFMFRSPFSERDEFIRVLVDITERKAAEKKLKAYNERLEELARQLLEVQESERRHVARELHDEIGQHLTALKLSLQIYRNNPQDLDRLNHCMLMIEDLMKQVREISLVLRPTMLDDLGILPTLLWHFKEFGKSTAIEVDFVHSGLNQRFPPTVETTVYRIVQEGMTNVARHSGVSSARVSVTNEGTAIKVVIQDEGAGFAPAAPMTSLRTGGLEGMRERVMLSGGSLAIDSAIGSGTTVEAIVPIISRSSETA